MTKGFEFPSKNVGKTLSIRESLKPDTVIIAIISDTHEEEMELSQAEFSKLADLKYEITFVDEPAPKHGETYEPNEMEKQWKAMQEAVRNQKNAAQAVEGFENLPAELAKIDSALKFQKEKE